MGKKRPFMERSAHAGLKAVVEVYFPENEDGVPDWRDTNMIDRTISYLDTLPPANRRVIYLLYVAVEWLTPLWLAGIGRFSKRSIPFRTRAVRRWQSWDFLPFRLLSDGIKAQISMLYLSHSTVQKHLGVWKSCAREADPYPLPTRKGFLESFAEKDAETSAEVQA